MSSEEDISKVTKRKMLKQGTLIQKIFMFQVRKMNTPTKLKQALKNQKRLYMI